MQTLMLGHCSTLLNLLDSWFLRLASHKQSSIKNVNKGNSKVMAILHLSPNFQTKPSNICSTRRQTGIMIPLFKNKTGNYTILLVTAGAPSLSLFPYLDSLHSAICKCILQPLGNLEALVRQISMKRQRNSQHASKHIQSHKHTKRIPGECRRGKQA